jgi:rhodanese-related sulfurtransferase
MTLVIIITVIVGIIVFVNLNKNKGLNKMNAEEANELVKNPEVKILDVRNPDEFKSGHLKNATLIPVSNLAARIQELDSYKEKQILVYCHSGMRSSAACGILTKNGFTKVVNLSGGISSWIAKGFKTVS